MVSTVSCFFWGSLGEELVHGAEERLEGEEGGEEVERQEFPLNV